jgi:hypothetical protein
MNNLKYLKYKNKYLKYKNKYGGSNNVIKDIDLYNYIYMVIILLPFDDIVITISDEYIKKYFIDNINNKLKDYYLLNNINLKNRRSLVDLGFLFDDKPNYLQLNIENLITILNNVNIKQSIDIFIDELIKKYDDKTSIISNIHVQPKDLIYENIKDNKIKIHYFNNENISLYNENREDNNKKYGIYSNTNVVIREELSNLVKEVFIFFGFKNDEFYAFNGINRDYKGLIFYFIDNKNEWYRNKLDLYVEIIKKYTNKPYEKYIFFGWSMGGYASIYASLLYSILNPEKKCIVISFSPQIKNLEKTNNIIIDSIQKKEDDKQIDKLSYIEYDIIDILKKGEHNTKIYTLVGRSECDATRKTIFLDIFHIGNIINYNNVSTIIYNLDEHAIAPLLNLELIANKIAEKFDILYENQNSGNKLLYEIITKK